MKKQVLYGCADYEKIVEENGYFVDKTDDIEKLESIKNPLFLRPRRFGKSLFCRMLESYYAFNRQDDFERLFGHTYISDNYANKGNHKGCPYMIVKLRSEVKLFK
jgi:hypothetical protein